MFILCSVKEFKESELRSNQWTFIMFCHPILLKGNYGGINTNTIMNIQHMYQYISTNTYIPVCVPAPWTDSKHEKTQNKQPMYQHFEQYKQAPWWTDSNMKISQINNICTSMYPLIIHLRTLMRIQWNQYKTHTQKLFIIYSHNHRYKISWSLSSRN